MEAGLPARLHHTPSAGPAGIVHLGLGAFFRAHGAIYVEQAMAAFGGDWGIIGVSLQSPGTRDRLAPQGWAYTALQLGPEGETAQVVTVLRDVLLAPENPQAVLDAMTAPAVRIVSLTVTEKGYCHEPSTGRLNADHPDIRHDLDNPLPRSAPGFLVRALQARRAAGIPPFTVLCCDNLPENGHVVRGVVLDLARLIDPDLAVWIEAQGAFPSTMVDRIVPATTPTDLDRVETLTGRRDEAPVMHEPFRQWVVEDRFCNGRPDLGAVGVQLVDDVTPFEHMKLRMLNGTHSSLAYLGYLAGHQTIADTMADPVMAQFVDRLWRSEIIPALTPPPGTDLAAYADALAARYANPAIRHRTWQIAMDGSQKLPQRILGTIAEGRAAGRPVPGLTLAVAAWMRYASGRDETCGAIEVKDPLALQMAALWRDDPAATVDGFLALSQVFPAVLRDDAGFRADLTDALTRLVRDGARVAASG
ncbi:MULTISPECIES: mannitol dehydrogenase family protein [Paracoccus]|uniref:mannitol dehydrogenase family protein n=1 Tax=Paracoccus TaxID=265 RepID=UPI000FDAB684|nr:MULTISPECIES: mannitol dehydrogenase family protein [Paracoccus]AZY94367.1 mannitol dehydrogenase family protein [Paracoccus sp. Arc7-R13]TNC05196.1 mannitol dehydrogenase family protein [Paracoccus marcusii]